jgi:hypothetical protein
MDTFIENKDQKIALAIAIVFHMILLFIFLSIIFIKPVPSVKMLDVISLGMFDDNNENFQNKLEINGTSQNVAIIPANNFKEKILTDPSEEDVYVSAAPEIKQLISPDLQNILMKIHRSENSNGIKNDQSHGITNNSTVIQAEETSITEGVFLTHRILMEKPAHISDSSEEGIVVVAIIVNEFGKVVNAIAGQRGSTTTSSNLYVKACQAAYEAKFNASPDGVKEQRGTYTFVFTLE